MVVTNMRYVSDSIVISECAQSFPELLDHGVLNWCDQCDTGVATTLGSVKVSKSACGVDLYCRL